MKRILFLISSFCFLLSDLRTHAAAAGAWANQPVVTTLNDTNQFMAQVANNGDTNDNKLITIANTRTLMRGLPTLSTYPGSFAIIDGTGAVAWFNPRNHMILYDEFNGGTSTAGLDWNNGSSGTSANFGSASPIDAGHPFIYRVTTGTTTTGKGEANLTSLGNGMAFGQGRIFAEWLIDIDTLSDDTDDFILRVGFGDTQSGAPVDGMIARYNDNVNGGQWQFITANNSTYTTNNTTVAVTASTTGTAWTRLTFDVDAAGANAILSINGTPAATNSANIPVTSARATAPYILIEKTLGTTARICYADYFWAFGQFTTPR